MLASDLNFNIHVNYVLPKAYKLLGFIKRNCLKEFSKSTLRQLYVSLVRPQIDYATVVWNPNDSHLNNTSYIENVQRRFFKLMCFKSQIEYHRIDYISMCKQYSLPTLYYRRQVKDLLFLYKIVHNCYDCSLLGYLNFKVPCKYTRKFDTFVSPKSRINVYKYSCLCRIQSTYNNSIPGCVDLYSVSLSEFRAIAVRLD